MGNYYGNYANRNQALDSGPEVEQLVQSKAKHHSTKSLRDEHNSDMKIGIERYNEKPFEKNTSKLNATSLSARSPMKTKSSFFENCNVLGTRARFNHQKNWRKWIFFAIVVLVFFSLLCAILALDLNQTKTMKMFKEMISKCCAKTKNLNIKARNDSAV